MKNIIRTGIFFPSTTFATAKTVLKGVLRLIFPISSPDEFLNQRNHNKDG
ncbi:hypothetical protein Sjap_003007 [Stephania japonica]|uniref:Uncharacterized protein n=1 Tax=Stephania japonica TaxID=461633 RepID=A0AAP0PT60_9MAGN